MASLSDPVLAHLAEQIRAFATERGLEITGEPVQYGVRIRVRDSRLPDAEGHAAKAGGVLYHSAKKKRVSWVPEGKNDKALARILNDRVTELIGQRNGSTAKKPAAGASAAERGLACWVGSDEAGKGDIFGALVVGAFVATPALVSELAELGVRDSKDLRRGEIKRLAATLRDRWPDRCHLVAMRTAKYNELYDKFETQGGINGVLGWAHAAAIKEAASGPHPITAAVVDRFAGDHRVSRHLTSLKSRVQLITRPKAESNLAVAAGAILARAAFDRALDGMQDELGFRPHAGAGGPAMADLRKLATTHPDRLGEFVKLHFRPVKALGDLG